MAAGPIDDLVEDAQPQPFMHFGSEAPSADEAEQYTTHDRRTDNASWSLWSRYTGQPLHLRVRTAGLADGSWPSSSGHYATSAATATTALVSAGFKCPASCYRASDGQTVDFDEHDGQIVVVRFTLRCSSADSRRTDASGQCVRAGLPFLTPAVRAAVGQRVEQCRIERRSWSGVVAGTPVDINVVDGAATMPDDRSEFDLTVTMGIPLQYVE